jgi:hypothetical protein
MNTNLFQAEYHGQELRRDRMREAAQWRLVQQGATWNPSTLRKLSIILSTYWKGFWSRVFRKRGYIPISQTPKESPSL